MGEREWLEGKVVKLERENGDLFQRVGDLERIVELYVSVEYTSRLRIPSLDEIIQKVVADNFSVNHLDLLGRGEINRPGPKRRLTYDESQLLKARDWMIILYVIYYPEWSQSKLSKHYTWLSERSYLQLRDKRELIRHNPRHKDRPVWLELIKRVTEYANQYETEQIADGERIKSGTEETAGVSG